MKTVKAYCPVSSGNVAVGFDVLGACMAPVDGSLWGDVVELRAADSFSFRADGPFASRLPPVEENLVLRAKELFCQAYKPGRQQMEKVAITLHKNLPIKSGLGSSTSSLIAALTAYNAWCGKPLSLDELMVLGGRGEGSVSGGVHVDNVAPALLGGLQLITPAWNAQALPFPENLLFVVISPELEVATSVARAALPKEVPFQTAVLHAQNLASFIHALHTNQPQLLRQTFRDLLAEPHRAALVKGFREVKAAAMGAGAWACSLSGAGAAMFAVVEPPKANAVVSAMTSAFNAAGVECVGRICKLDRQGARLIP